jgi:EAL domain-containing protein (putative c-di-GMP-specific phosphodiesterase class I)
MQMNLGGTHLQLVRTVRSLAQNIGVFAVAEGVETAEQLDTLRSMGCESAQGYLFSKPISAHEAGLLLETDPHW